MIPKIIIKSRSTVEKATAKVAGMENSLKISINVTSLNPIPLMDMGIIKIIKTIGMNAKYLKKFMSMFNANPIK